jgi:DNA-binding PucR family transcriptional regulator
VVWDPPSPAAAALLREAAEYVLEHSGELAGLLDAAVFSVTPDPLREDVTLGAEAAASNRANLVHWASTMREDPGARVPVKLSPEVLAVARDALRRGADQMLLSSYHASQNVAWRYSMQLLFSLSSDPEVLREALELAARSIFAFIDDTVAALHDQIERERAELTRGTHAERLEVVNLILEGAPISTDQAGARLRYDLRQRHTAAIIWTDGEIGDRRDLDRAAELLARAGGARRPLTVIASVASVWVWVGTPDGIDPRAVAAALETIVRARVALGRAGAGIDGFRRSHLDALATQRLMSTASDDLRVAGFGDVELVVLAAHDRDRAGEFVNRTLGELATADPILRHTVRTYIREQFSPTRTARALYTHRNTVLNRLQRAEQLLPAPLDGRGVEVGLALEIVHWVGVPGAR